MLMIGTVTEVGPGAGSFDTILYTCGQEERKSVVCLTVNMRDDSRPFRRCHAVTVLPNACCCFADFRNEHNFRKIV
jgi:hypothetical protein